MDFIQNIPSSWTETNLEALLDFVIGGDWGKEPEELDPEFVEVACIRGSEFRNWDRDKGATASPRAIKKSSLETRQLKAGDILVEISGGGPDQPVGRTVLIDAAVLAIHKGKPIVCTNFLRLARPSASVDSFYLNQFLKLFYSSGAVINYQGGSNNLRNLKFKEYVEIGVPLPPLAEQKQIAAKLDELLAQVDTIKTRLDAIPHILKRFRQSVLAAAVSGKLTEEWRDLNKVDEPSKELKERWLRDRESQFNRQQTEAVKNGRIKKKKQFCKPAEADLETRSIDVPSEWEIVSVAEFADCLDSQRIPVKKDARQTSQGLFPYFGANGEVDRVDEYIFDGDFVMVTEDETFYGRTKPIAYRFTGKCWVNNHAHILSAPNKVANDYLCFALMYFDVIPWLSGTTGRAKLTQAALNSLPIGLPSEAEQTEIVRRVEQLFAYADQIEQRVKDAQARVNHLTQSILAKAFRGELTADWRAQNPDLISGDNSAEALLARIRAEREAAGSKPKTRRKKA